MATKTVINCREHNMAQTNKGISIIIDPQAGYDKTMNTTNIIQIKHSNEKQQFMTTTTTTVTNATTLLTLNDNIIGNGNTNNNNKTLIDIKTNNDTQDEASNDHSSHDNHEVKQQQHILQIDCCNTNTNSSNTSNTIISPLAKEKLEFNRKHLTELRGNEQHQQQYLHNDDVSVYKEHLNLANDEEKDEDENDEADGEINKNSLTKQLKQQFNLTLVATKEEEDDNEESGQTASQQQQQQQQYKQHQQQEKHKEKEHYGAVQQSCFEQVEENANALGNGNNNSKTRENGQSCSINETKQKTLLTDNSQNESDDNEKPDNNNRNNNEIQNHNDPIHREENHNNDGDHNDRNCCISIGSNSISSSGISMGSDCITQAKREVADDFSYGKRSLYEENSNSLLTQADALTTTNTKSSKTLLTINAPPLSLTNLNFKENFDEKSTAKKNKHVVKIQIKPNNNSTNDNNNILTEKQITVVKIENLQKSESIENSNNNFDNNNSNNNTASEKIENEQKLEKGNEVVNMVQKPSNNNANATTVMVTNVVNNANLNLNVANTPTSNTNANGNSNGNGHGNGNGTLTGSSTTVTELNVSNPQYLYYMMSSGQFSPCDTLDSGTGSDLESNGQQNQDSNTMQMKKSSCSSTSSSTVSTNSLTPLEMQLKNAKARLGNGKNNNSNLEIQQRQCSFTDSEESEASSLSCDSLHSNEFLRQSSTSPTPLKNSNSISSNNSKKIKSLLPDSLLREIKNLKFTSNDYEAENEAEDDEPKVMSEPADYIKSHEFIQSRKNLSNLPLNISSSLKRASLPSKTFVLNTEDGTFIDTKMNSMPRTYEADKYYNFHVNEHDNFRSFGSNNSNDGDSFSISDFETKSLHDDVFAGYRDIRCGSNTSTIRSSKGTVRGVKNRVRNGIATFLQLQQPNIKNYKEKDSGKVVLYTTSMGIIRDTYAKCSNVKKILRTLLVKFEERDVFMSVEYQQEIKERMHSDVIKVPQLYVEGQHIGDADTVERLNETGELRQLLKPYKSISTTYTCQTCGGYRLLPCPSCNGSKKSVHRNHFTAEFVALKCMNCDEVGLVKCHNC